MNLNTNDIKIEIDLWGLMAKHKMNAVELSNKTWISEAQLSNIKAWNTKGIEFETMKKFLLVFDCQIQDLIKVTYLYNNNEWIAL